jgi:hypothetical protein
MIQIINLTEDQRFKNLNTGTLFTGKEIQSDACLRHQRDGTVPVLRMSGGRLFITVPLRNRPDVTYVRTR